MGEGRGRRGSRGEKQRRSLVELGAKTRRDEDEPGQFCGVHAWYVQSARACII